MDENDWYQITDERKLEELCQRVLDENPKLVEEWKKGKKRAHSKIVKAVIRSSNNLVHMGIAGPILEQALKRL